jgi:hypothetical protein
MASGVTLKYFHASTFSFRCSYLAHVKGCSEAIRSCVAGLITESWTGFHAQTDYPWRKDPTANISRVF